MTLVQSDTHVFLSYARVDRRHMERVVATLSARSMTVWTDAHLSPGTPRWTREIELAIERSHAVVVILTPNSKRSEWVEREITYAQDRDKRIIPILAEGTPQTSVPLALATSQRLDARRRRALDQLPALLGTGTRRVEQPRRRRVDRRTGSSASVPRPRGLEKEADARPRLARRRRGLVVAVVAISLLAVGVVSGNAAEANEREADAMRAASARGIATMGADGIIRQVQDERDATVVYLLGVEGSVGQRFAPLADERRATDAGVDSLRVTATHLDEQGRAAYEQAVDGLGRLSTLRDLADAYEAGDTLSEADKVETMFSTYTAVASDLISDLTDPVPVSGGIDLDQAGELAVAALRHESQASRVVFDAVLTSLTGPADGINTVEESAAVTEHLGDLYDVRDVIAREATGEFGSAGREFLRAPGVHELSREVEDALDSGHLRLDDLLDAWMGAESSRSASTWLLDQVTTVMTEQAEAAAESLRPRHRAFTAGAILASAIGVFVPAAATINRLTTRTRTIRSETRATGSRRRSGSTPRTPRPWSKASARRPGTTDSPVPVASHQPRAQA